MFVKNEPECDFDVSMEMIDVETSLLREELFGNHYSIPCASSSDNEDFSSGLESQEALDNFMLQMGMTSGSSPSHPLDVSESSSDDDLINKLSSDLEMPLPLDGFEPSPSWSNSSKNILDTFTSDITSVIKSEDDLTAEELTRVFYPNMECSNGNEITSNTSNNKKVTVKREPSSPQNHIQLPPSPDDSHDIWELLCDADIKPCVNTLITPPVTPPQNVDSSPPNSPQPPSPVGPSTTIMLSQPTPRQNQGADKYAQPIKVLCITTKNGTTTQTTTKVGRVTKNMKIQPKVVTNNATQPQVISIVNSSNGQKITIPKSVVTTRNLANTGARVVQLKPPPAPARVTTTSTTVTNSIPSILTTQIGSASTVLTPPAPPPPCTTPLTPLAPALTPGMKQGIPDIKALKRQQRMIKNRESASLSRKKKKEYVTALEGTISDLKNENNKLKEDNARLQQRVSSLESEVTTLRQAIGRNPSRKTTTALFALIFLLSLNLGPLTGVLLSNKSRLSSLKTFMQGSEPSSVVSGFKHRSLLWSEDNISSSDDSVTSQFGTNASFMCPMYINASESLRLETELRGLFENKLGAPKMDKKMDRFVASHPKTKLGRSGATKRSHSIESVGASQGAIGKVWNALAPPSLNMKANPPRYHYIHPDVLHVEPSTSNDENTSVMATVPRLSSFLEAIQRRDDTYYVVSFSPDHLLVPATARNDSARPRMSLLMPTPRPMNDSLAPPEDHIALMQIDCEVIHTRLVHVSEEVVPPHLRAGGSNASHPSPDTTTSHRQERRNSRAKARAFIPKTNYPAK